MNKVSKEWIQSAESDLAIIRHIIHDETLTHQVAFHAQQAIEKCLKAIIEEFELGFIKTHSLRTLTGITNPKLPLNIEKDLILLLDQLYIDARYPGEIGLLPFGKPSITDAQEFHQIALKVYKDVNESLERI
jgi:HEPN domain-containing protein